MHFLYVGFGTTVVGRTHFAQVSLSLSVFGAAFPRQSFNRPLLRRGHGRLLGAGRPLLGRHGLKGALAPDFAALGPLRHSWRPFGRTRTSRE
jgi:hypothetical protein